MEHEHKERLAHRGDTGVAACAIRLRAARIVTGLQAKDLARECGISKTVLSNAENGANYPSHKVMKHLYRAHRIDFNFLMNGDFVQLPGDVQCDLLLALETANSEWDQKQRSSRASPEGTAWRS